jgi:surface polysaccharide O-acyltransferase-like enzyme
LILQKLYAVLYGLYMFLQNLFFAIFAGFLTILAVPMFLISGILSSEKKKEKSKDIKTD